MSDKDFDARLDLVPASPGVYLMKDETGTVIYVGKAINLRRRLRSYFGPNPQGNRKVLAMISHIDSYSYLLVDNELEALLLESNLIKHYQPFYNILLKDDHDYPYIKVTMQEEFPKISKAYRIGPDQKDGAKYYGPYLNSDVSNALRVIRKLFPLKIYHRIFQTEGKSEGEISFQESLDEDFTKWIADAAETYDSDESKTAAAAQTKISSDTGDTRDNETGNYAEKASEYVGLDYKTTAKLNEFLRREEAIKAHKANKADAAKERNRVNEAANSANETSAASSGDDWVVNRVVSTENDASAEKRFRADESSQTKQKKKSKSKSKARPVMDPLEYRKIVADICKFLEGDYSAVKKRMEAEMQQASSELDFEKAAVWRDRIQDLMRLQEKQVAVLEQNFNGDVIGLARNSIEVCVLKLEVRGGRITGTATYFLDAVANTDEEIITAFILQYYPQAAYIPPTIMLPVPADKLEFALTLNRDDSIKSKAANAQRKSADLSSGQDQSSENNQSPEQNQRQNQKQNQSSDQDLSLENVDANLELELLDFLHKLAGHKVDLHYPRRGDKKKVMDMANRNAKQALQRKTLIAGSNPESIETALELLQEILAMPHRPERIEIYDISNTGAEDQTCGMGVFINGKVARDQSRIFNIKRQESQDDYSAMQEAVDRRLSHLGDDNFGAKPDLILADGGRGHVNALKPVLAAHGVSDSIYLAGLVKDQRHRTRGLVTSEGEIIELAESLDLLDGQKTYGSGNKLGSAAELFSTEKSSQREEQLALLRLLSAIQNEAHRVAGKENRKLNKKRQTKYKLEEIPGVGPARRKQLLKEFTSMKEIALSSEQEILERVPSLGSKTAHNVYMHFHPEEFANNSTDNAMDNSEGDYANDSAAGAAESAANGDSISNSASGSEV